ncbi:MAG TPA: hypothetical protein P5556_07960 [Candidatus Gastranaerophilales bacterium]|nr:hypothetical protein [Candidatus Gastranaerophilales bacterium]
MTDEFEEKKEALKFLERDFNQCFQQMRHYDSQIFEIFKFLFTLYTGLIGISIGLYQFGIKENIDFTPSSIAILLIGFLLGIFLFIVIVRNRAYFVQVTRYINEQRALFFKFEPLGFKNTSKMYTNSQKPNFFDRHCSQIWYLYVVALMNSILIGVSIYILYKNWIAIGICFLLSSFAQMIYAYSYLKTRENKTAEQAIFE